MQPRPPAGPKPSPLGVAAVNGATSKAAMEKAAAEKRALEEKLTRLEEEHRQRQAKGLTAWHASAKAQMVSELTLHCSLTTGVT